LNTCIRYHCRACEELNIKRWLYYIWVFSIVRWFGDHVAQQENYAYCWLICMSLYWNMYDIKYLFKFDDVELILSWRWICHEDGMNCAYTKYPRMAYPSMLTTVFIILEKYFSSIDDDMEFEFVWSALSFQSLYPKTMFSW